MRPAAARSASVVPAILALAFTCAATTSYAQNSQGSGNIFDQLKKASGDMSSLFNSSKGGGSGGKSSGSGSLSSGSSSATQVGSFSFVLRGCQNDENTGVTCHFRATNLSSDRALQVAGGNASYIIDANGGQHVAQSIRLGTGEGATMTTTNVPVEGTIAFGVFDPGVRKIAELHLLVTGGQLNWHNVSLQAAAKSEDTDNDNNQEQPAHHSEDSGSSGERSVKVASSEAPAHGPRLTNDDVIKLVKAGLGESTIVQMIDGSTPDFDTSANGLIALKQAGASDAVLQHIFTRQQQGHATQAN